MATATITPLQEAQAEFEQARSDLASARQSGNADRIADAKRNADRLRAKVNRLAKGGKSSGPIPKGTSNRKPASGNGNGGGKSARERLKSQAKNAATAAKEAPTVAENVITPGEKPVKKNKNPESLTRTPKGNVHRVTRKNRKLGVHISIYDASIDRRFKADRGRWAVVCEESGQYVQSKTWAGCGPLITDPTTWLDPAFVQERLEAKAA